MANEHLKDINWLREHWDELTPSDCQEIVWAYPKAAFAKKTDKYGVDHLVFLPTGGRIY